MIGGSVIPEVLSVTKPTYGAVPPTISKEIVPSHAPKQDDGLVDKTLYRNSEGSVICWDAFTTQPLISVTVTE